MAMAYRIKYNLVGPDRQKPRKKKRTGAIVTVLAIGGLLVIAIHLLYLPWPQKLLLPGDAAVTAAALEGLAENLQQGESLMDAITCFCRNIIANGT